MMERDRRLTGSLRGQRASTVAAVERIHLLLNGFLTLAPLFPLNLPADGSSRPSRVRFQLCLGNRAHSVENRRDVQEAGLFRLCLCTTMFNKVLMHTGPPEPQDANRNVLHGLEERVIAITIPHDSQSQVRTPFDGKVLFDNNDRMRKRERETRK